MKNIIYVIVVILIIMWTLIFMGGDYSGIVINVALVIVIIAIITIIIRLFRRTS